MKLDDNSALCEAVSLATRYHRGQVDKAGEAYILHIMRVIVRLKCPEDQIVAALHDIIEDTPCEMEDLRMAGFSINTLSAIDSLTRRKGEKYKTYVRRCCQDPTAARVKMADVKDHLAHNRWRLTEEHRKRYRWAEVYVENMIAMHQESKVES